MLLIVLLYAVMYLLTVDCKESKDRVIFITWEGDEYQRVPTLSVLIS